jgi:5-methyltetrahydrofolate--homocysteine methyltransferase
VTRERTLVDRVRSGQRLLADGGWGTMLMARGLEPGRPPESLLLERPEVVAEVARLYLEAGAQILTTNSFGASPLALERHGLLDRTDQINRLAVTTLRDVIGDAAYVSASVGPTGRLLEPYGDVSRETMKAAFERQLGGLLEAGPDVVCVETMIDLSEARLAVEAAKRLAPEMPVMATMTFDRTPRGFFTVMGVSIEQAARGLAEAGADLVGSNCGHGSATMVEIARGFRAHTALPLLIQPNAGIPESRAGEVIYPETPEQMADWARQLLEVGVAVVGGCCGTTPDHIRALRQVVPAAA